MRRDPWVQALTPEMRKAVALRWEQRIKSELQVGRSFVELSERLEAAGKEGLVLQLARESAEQERRHAELCHELAELYGERTISWPDLNEWAPVKFGHSNPELEFLVALLAQTCISETIASGWLRACVRHIESPRVRAAYALHLREELNHARVGWTFLAAHPPSEEMRDALSSQLSALVDVNVRAWEDEANFLPGEGLPSHGMLSREDSILAVHDTTSKVIYPGFALHGIQPAAR